MNDHVTKPIEPDALMAALKRWTKPREKRTPALADEPAPAANEVILPGIEGIDVAGGLKRVAGNRRLYRSLLEQFAAKQGDAGTLITAALGSGDRALAGRIAHTVKGVAGNLGIGPVQAAAARIESAIRDEEVPAAALLEEFGSKLGVMIQAIQVALTGTAPEPPATTHREVIDAGAVSAAVMRLRKLIEANDGDAVDALPAVEAALAGIIEKPHLDALRDALDDFDFDRALARLTEITRLTRPGGES